MNLSGKRIVITGVSSGIGERTAQLALAGGAEVIGLDRRPCGLPLQGFFEIDLNDAASIDAALARVPGSLDALVNNAGVSGVAGAAKALTINFYGMRRFTEGLLGRVREGGSVVTVSSIAGFGWNLNVARARTFAAVEGMPDAAALAAQHGVDDATAYSLSKEMVRIWSMQSARRWRPRRLRFNTVSPGPVETAILPEFRATVGDAQISRDIERIGRAGTPSDIAPVLLFLCSEASRWINGANIPVDGSLEAAIHVDIHGL